MRANHYKDLPTDYSKPGLVSAELGQKLLRNAEKYIALREDRLPEIGPAYNLERIEKENKDWWLTHCEALRQGRGDLLAEEYARELVYFCADGPFYGRNAAIIREANWWAILAQPGVTMVWPIVMPAISNVSSSPSTAMCMHRQHRWNRSSVHSLEKRSQENMVAQSSQVKGKIGVLIEAHFDETEFRKFNEFFPTHGYEIEYITHLWGQDNLTFKGNDFTQEVTVSKEVAGVNLADYKAIILIGGYAMDRLRYQEHPRQGQPNTAPAVEFLRKAVQAMDQGRLKIGTICHSLWLFCAAPETLRRRRVTCA